MPLGMLITAYTDEEIIAVAKSLPSAPRLLVSLDTLMANPRTDIDDIAALIKQDPAIVAQLLRMSNSAAYAPTHKIGHLEQALGLVGFAEIHRLIGAIAAQQLADPPMRLYPIDGTQLRINTLFVAVLMEELAKQAKESPRRAYTIGLLRTIGMMALEHLAPPGHTIPPFQNAPETALHDWECKHWGFSNVEITEKILLNWGLPNETVSAIRHHCDPGRRHNPMVHLLLLAATAAADRFSAIPGEEVYWNPKPDTLGKAGLGPKRFQAACERAALKFDQVKLAIA